MRRVTLAIAVAALSFSATQMASAQDILRTLYSSRPVAQWTGMYIGGNFGYGWGHVDTTAGSPFVVSGSTSIKGVLGGGQVGGMAMSGIWAFGLETDIQFSAQKGTIVTPGTFGGSPFALTQTNRFNWFGTTRARAGVVADQLLIYLTAGAAYGEYRNDVTATGSLVGAASYSTVRAGWAVGGGLEGMVTKNWTWRAEYLHVELGKFTQSFLVTAGTTSTTNVDFRLYNDIVRFSVNYYLR